MFRYRSVSVAGFVFQACSSASARVEFSASYGEMSRRSGIAAEEETHSDIFSRKWNQQSTEGGKRCKSKLCVL